MKKYVIIAGVNGAGKTTFYSAENAFEDLEIINLDDAVRQIGTWRNPVDVKKAAERVIKRIDECFDRGISFLQETTLCGKGIANNINRARTDGYYIELFYIGLDSFETAKNRVHSRVERGGHGIPDDDIERRYHESMHNLKTLLPLCDRALIYDNTDKLTITAIYVMGECKWSAKSKPDWYRQIFEI